MLHRCHSFAERLGRANARNIVLHYLGVVGFTYIILQLRAVVKHYEESCWDEEASNHPSRPYWAATICSVSTSSNMFLVGLRKYLDFSTYYIALFIVGLETLVMLAISKHLWRALRLEEKKRTPKRAKGDRNSISIDMDECSCNLAGCVDDSFFVDLVLATYEFFKVSDSKTK